MISKASCFNISGALIGENLRRFWTLPVVTFLVYFLSGVFPILLQYNDIERRYIASYIENMLANQHPLFIALYVAIPLISASVVFRYMQQSASTSSVHAMPFSRSKLFNTNIVSGFLMCIMPVIATGLILLCIAKPTYYGWAYDTNGNLDTANAINVFARSEILYWMGETIMVMFFVFAIAVFAGIVTGNTVMHILAGIGFNFLVPAISVVGVFFSSMYLYGYVEEFEWILSLTPVFKAVSSQDHVSTALFATYILIGIAILVLSAILYQKRKLERAGDSLVFATMIPIICYLIAFFGMSLFGAYFMLFGDSEIYKYVGFAIGTLIAFILGRMIVLKTPKIFNSQSLKSLGGYVLIAVIFIASFALDLTGFENRVPDVSNISAVNNSTVLDIIPDRYSRFDSDNFNIEQQFLGTPRRYYHQLQFMDPENIERIIALHEQMIENKDGENDLRFRRSTSVPISYIKGNGKVIERRYQASIENLAKNENIAALYESSEFKEKYALANLNYNKIGSIQIYNNLTDTFARYTDEDAMDLIHTLDKDFADRTFAEEMDKKEKELFDIILDYSTIDVTMASGQPEDWEMNHTITFRLLSSDTNTIEWIKNHCRSDVLEYSSADVQKIQVTKYDDIGETVWGAVETSMVDETIEQAYSDVAYTDVATIVDKDKIDYILKHADGQLDRYQNYYDVTVFGWGSEPEYAIPELDYLLKTGQIDDKFYEAHAYRGTDYAILNLYFTEEEAPDFIKELFK